MHEAQEESLAIQLFNKHVTNPPALAKLLLENGTLDWEREEGWGLLEPCGFFTIEDETQKRWGLWTQDSRINKDLGFGSWVEGTMLQAPNRSHGQEYLKWTTAGG